MSQKIETTLFLWHLYWIFAKQKTDVPKARKMAAGGLGNAVSPPVEVGRQSPKKVLIFFLLKHGKTAIVKVKIQ